MTYTTTTATTTTLSAPNKVPTSTFETRLNAALEHARRLTEMSGTSSIDRAIAWETVEELQTARARTQAAPQSAFERYCAANPDAPECRIYES